MLKMVEFCGDEESNRMSRKSFTLYNVTEWMRLPGKRAKTRYKRVRRGERVDQKFI